MNLDFKCKQTFDPGHNSDAFQYDGKLHQSKMYIKHTWMLLRVFLEYRVRLNIFSF